MIDHSEKDEISSIEQCRRGLIVMLGDGRMVITEEEKATVNQVINYLDRYKVVVRESYQTE